MSEVVAFYKPNDNVEGLRIMQELGQGAASTVYLAQDVKTKQIWALKHVHRSTEKDERFLNQAIAEYEVAQGIGPHPAIRGIPKMFRQRAKLFTTTDVFLVMEFADGYSMEKKRPRTYEEALEVFIQVADGLRHMHEHGYVHADMKPNNIMISPGPLVKIVDLGQSCEIGTVKERIQGTPDYIAPEQAFLQPITPQTDVYNLGATMYWTLTKSTIPTALNAGENSLAGKIDPSLLERPRPVTEVDPKCHPKLNELIMHCVEPDPNDRPSSMGFVRDRLELILGMIRAQKKVKPDTKPGAGDSGLLMDASATGSASGKLAPKPDSRSSSTSVLGVRVNQDKPQRGQ